MKNQERIGANPLLLLKFFPNEGGDSPTVGQIQALADIKRGKLVTEDVVRAILATAERKSQEIVDVIEEYNGWLSEGASLSTLTGMCLGWNIAASYGLNTDEGEKHRVGLLNMGVREMLNDPNILVTF